MDTLAKSVSVQAVLAIMLTATSCAIWLQGRVVPQDLILLNGIVAAFYFGNKIGQQAQVSRTDETLGPPSFPGE